MKLSKAVIKKYGITKKAWQVQRGQSGSSGRSRSTTTKTQVKSMAKKRKSSGSRSGFGGNLMKPFIKTDGMVGDALKGIGTATLVAKFAPQLNIPYKNLLAGYATGGAPGAIGAWFVFGTGATGSTAGSSDVWN